MYSSLHTIASNKFSFPNNERSEGETPLSSLTWPRLQHCLWSGIPSPVNYLICYVLIDWLIDWVINPDVMWYRPSHVAKMNFWSTPSSLPPHCIAMAALNPSALSAMPLLGPWKGGQVRLVWRDYLQCPFAWPGLIPTISREEGLSRLDLFAGPFGSRKGYPSTFLPPFTTSELTGNYTSKNI